MTSDKLAKTSQPIAPIIAKRWSSRAIDQNRPVDRGDLLGLLEAARWAPSCYGDEPWRYIVWNRFDNESDWKKAFGCLAEGNQSWVRDAPVLMVSLADSEFTSGGKPNRWGQHDTGAASENLCLQAAELDLVAHQMGGFDADAIRRTFAVPDRYVPMAMIAVGHPGPADELPERYRPVEAAERERRPLGETFFAGTWGAPVE